MDTEADPAAEAEPEVGFEVEADVVPGSLPAGELAALVEVEAPVGLVVVSLGAAGAVVVGSEVGFGGVVVGLVDGLGVVGLVGGVVLGDGLGVGVGDGLVGFVVGVVGFVVGVVGLVVGGRLVGVAGGCGVAGVEPGAVSSVSGSGVPRSGSGVSPSTEPRTRVAWNSRDQRTGTSRTFRPVRGASTIMPLPAYMATWWMPRQLLE